MTKQSDLILYIICIAVMVWSAFSAVRLTCKVVRSRSMLRALRKENEAVVHGISVQYKAGAYLFVMALELFELFFFGRYLIPVRRVDGYMTVLLGVLCISALVTLVIHMIGLFREKHVYLTKNGLITFVECHTYSACRFAWENSSVGMSDMLYVYIKKDQLPFTVRFDGNPAPAHALTEQYASGEPEA